MGFEWDAELAPMMTAMFEMRKHAPKVDVGDALTRRQNFNPMLEQASNTLPYPDDVAEQQFTTKSYDGHEITLYWFHKKNATATATPGPAFVHAHGGGMILGSVKILRNATANVVSMSGVPQLSVEYRLAPEHPHPAPVEDCYAGLVYLRDHAAELNVDPKRIGVMGESAGGGLAAALALMARDRKLEPPVAKQVLIYPMLDDRTVKPDENLVPFMFWSYDDNKTAWGALLGGIDKAGGDDTSPYAAPARVKDVTNLPDAYIDVGQLDIFVYDDLDYASRLTQAGVNVEIHLYPGVCHGWDLATPQAAVTQRAVANRLRAMTSF